ncbi:MAG: alpha/beta hydrolase [Verrucomicrobiota bacterium]
MRWLLLLLLAVLPLVGLPACRTTVAAPGLHQTRVSGTAENLEQARLAWNIMAQRSPRSLAARQARQRYNSAVAAVLTSIHPDRDISQWGKSKVVEGAVPWRISFDASPRVPVSTTLSPQDFSGCELARDITLTDFEQTVARDGVGVPVVLERKDGEGTAPPFQPPAGEFLPATAVLEFPQGSSAGTTAVRLRFYNVMEASSVAVGGRDSPLAENLTAALERSLTNAAPEPGKPGDAKPTAWGEQESRLFFLQRYDPHKTPVVFVHGLLCGPVIWKNAVNAMLADPELRRRYQPACFMYPSGMPIPVTAARLRDQLREARDTLDPGHRDAGFGNTVLVGHSMGGLVSRMQVIDSGKDFWNAFFTAPRWKVARSVDAGTRRMLDDSLFFKREPDVARVIFICTPHRGSELADVGIYQTILRLVLFLPKTAKDGLEKLAELPVSFIQPELRGFSDRGVRGTETLSTKHPFFDALAKRPIQVPFHSIIATDRGLDFRSSSDRIVPYTSAHLEGAASETLVPYWHGCVEMPETVAAVLKILRDR